MILNDIFLTCFFLCSSSLVFYLKCKLVRVDVPFVFKVLSDSRYRSATMSESHVEIEETDVFIYLFILKENVCCTVHRSYITFFFKHAQFDLEVL